MLGKLGLSRERFKDAGHHFPASIQFGTPKWWSSPSYMLLVEKSAKNGTLHGCVGMRLAKIGDLAIESMDDIEDALRGEPAVELHFCVAPAEVQ